MTTEIKSIILNKGCSALENLKPQYDLFRKIKVIRVNETRFINGNKPTRAKDRLLSDNKLHSKQRKIDNITVISKKSVIAN